MPKPVPQPRTLRLTKPLAPPITPRADTRRSSFTPGSPKAADWEIDYSELKLIKRIGNGNYGAVFMATWLGTAVAVKIPHKGVSSTVMERFKSEVALMTMLSHPNIVVFLGACLQDPHLCLVMEYAANGSLYHYLRDPTVSVTFRHILDFAIDTSRGMNYLHRRCGIINRDLKSTNLLIDANLTCKVCDFGLSRFSDDEASNLTAVGTPYWTAPEIIRQEPYDERADIYSFGIVMWELVVREEPYDGMPGLEAAFAAADRGLRPRIPAFTPDNWSELMQQCWSDKPDDRPGFLAILERLQLMRGDHDIDIDEGSVPELAGTTPFPSGSKVLVDIPESHKAVKTDDLGATAFKPAAPRPRKMVQRAISAPLPAAPLRPLAPTHPRVGDPIGSLVFSPLSETPDHLPPVIPPTGLRTATDTDKLAVTASPQFGASKLGSVTFRKLMSDPVDLTHFDHADPRSSPRLIPVPRRTDRDLDLRRKVLISSIAHK